MGVSGAGVRDTVIDGGNSRAGIGIREGIRGGVDDIEEGGSGSVIEGAGFGDGIDRKDLKRESVCVLGVE